MFNSKLYHIDALAGAGKTEATCREIAHLVRIGEKVLLVQPTKKLIEQTAKRLDELGINGCQITKIYKKTKSDYTSVVSRIHSHFNNATDDIGQVVITTIAAFDLSKNLHRAETWHFIGDEFTTGEVAIELDLKKTHSLLTDHIIVGDGHPYALVEGRTREDGGNGLEEVLREAGNDSTYRQLYDAAMKISSPDWDTYVHTDRYNALVSNDGSAKSLQIYARRKPDVFLNFKSCIFVSALFKNSSLYKVLSNYGIEFEEYRLTHSTLRYEQHKNGDQVEIHYLNIDKWSKRIADQHPDLLEAYEGYALGQIGDEKFMYISNKNTSHPILESGHGQSLPGKPHGLNEYMHINHVVVTSAYNASSTHSEWLRFVNITDDEIDLMIHCSEVYQVIMRSSLRNPDYYGLKKIFVPDVRTALFLHNLFSGSKMIEIGVDIPDSIGRKGPVKLYESSADKQSAYRNRKKNIAFLNKHFASLGCNVNVEGDTCYEPIRKIWGNNQIYKSNNDLYYSINIYKTIYDKGAMSCDAFTDFEFIDELFSKMNKNKIKSKNAAHLFNFTIFDKSPDRTRLSNDAIATPVLILDNDGGSLSYKKFIDIFENEKIIVFNTFSSTNRNPRWRAIIPLRRYAFSDEYKLIYKGVLCKLAEHGYVLDKPDPEQPDVRTHGFDLSKSSITSLFYFPCQAKEEGATFYESHIGEERALMDPDSLMELAASYQPKQTVSSVRFIRGNHSLNDAITRWREIGSIPGNGDDEFFKLAVAGFWSGLSADELRQLLIEEASYAHTPQHRLNRVDYLVNWVFTHFVVQKAA